MSRKRTTRVVQSVFRADNDFDDWTTVQIADAPHADHFDTDTFYRKNVPVTKAGVQSYHEDGKEIRMEKTADELRAAQWSLDNRPLIAHDDHLTPVSSTEEVLGFLRDPSFEGDKQYVDVYIPTDGRAASLIADGHVDLSVGFHHDTDPTNDDGVDAVQRELLYDHVALCPSGTGRWSHSDGVGLRADSEVAGITADADNHRFTEGDWVRWEYSGGSAVGRVTDWTDDGKLSVDGGSRVADDERVYKMRHWDDGSWGNMVVKSDSELSEASEPDSFESDTSEGDASETVSVDLTFSPDADSLSELDLTPPEAVQENAQMALDLREEYPDEIEGMTETGWARARQLASGEELSPADIADGTDGMANWWARHKPHTVEDGSLSRDESVKRWKDNSYVAGKGWGGVEGMKWAMRMKERITDLRADMATDDCFVGHGGYSLERQFAADKTVMDTITFEGTRNGSLDESEIPNEDFEAHYVLDADTKTESSYPLVDGDGMLRRGNVKSAWQLRGRAEDESFLVDVLEVVNTEFVDPPIDEAEFDNMESDSQMTNDNDTQTNDESALDVSDFSVDALADEHDGVAALRADKQELEAEIEELRADKEELEAEVEAYRADERESLVDEITDMTERWSADELQEMSLDELESKRDLVADLKSEFSADTSDVATVSTSQRQTRGTERKYESGKAHDLSDTA